jgi:hypothetical protein
MAKLTGEQAAFLRKHKIPLHMVFDASGMVPSTYQSAMRAADKHFAFGVAPCANGGHTLRARGGDCIQCGTKYIAYQLRDVKPADVYIAGSRSRRLFKIGSSAEVDRRLETLNKLAYGGASDWLCIAKARCKHGGKVEFAIHDKLKAFRIGVPYMDSGREVIGDELFRCDYTSARVAFISCVPDEERAGIWHHGSAKELYSFSWP